MLVLFDINSSKKIEKKQFIGTLLFQTKFIMILAPGSFIEDLSKRVKWEIRDLIGEGACGKVYSLKAVKGAQPTSYPLVVKIIPLPVGTGKNSEEMKRMCDTLFYEYNLFHGGLSTFPYRPKIPDLKSFHGVDNIVGVRFLVMERFERDLVGEHCMYCTV